MKTGRIVRVATNPKHGTFGTLVLEGQPLCNTLEPYSRDNAVGLSCIPAGQYIMEPQHSSTFGPGTYTVTEVQGRSYIRVHKGTYDSHTKGCIILGEKLGEINGEWALLSSGEALKEFKEKAAGEKILLTITEAY